MKFLELAELFEKLESTSSRNEMTALLAGFITRNRSESEQLAMAAYLFMGRVAPLFVPAEFNYSEKSMLNVMVGIATQLGGEVDITKLRSELGDAGLVAFQLSEKLDGSGKAEGYQVSDLYEQLWKIINTSGSGSIATKSNIAGEILVRLTPVEAKFFARIVSGKMRLGVSVKTFLDAISVALKGDKGMRERLDRCYGVDPDIGWLLYSMLTHGEGGVDGELVVGIPLHSRLVERVKDFDEVFTRLGEEIIFQPKFDGLRCQAHVGVKYVESTMGERVWIEPMKMHSSTAGEGGALGLFAADQSAGDSGVELFSRNLERMTSMFPDVVAELSKHIDEGTVLDCEVIGWDADTRSFLPFQETMSRKRKHGIDAATLDIPVKLFVFDILAYKGKSLLDKDTEERLELLDKLLSEVPARLADCED
ncbi:MAG: hypothetical protein QY318_01695 [Candidatus Dojkabacteria bacterium]|nr:MAG: hypothetical protein QY318_01695 [Candidatus Dojkabacteria bacterium]